MQNNPKRPPGKMNGLEGARFILALAVVVWHYYYYGPLHGEINQTAFFGGIFPLFSFAVEAFFIISGFVIVISAGNRHPAEFAIQRMVRLGPALFICASIPLIALSILPPPPRRWPNASSIGSYLSSILVLPLMATNGIDGSLWSLKHEIRFYVEICLFMMFIDIKKHAANLALAIILIDAALFAVEYFHAPKILPYLLIKKYTSIYAVYFAMGILIYSKKFTKESNVKLAALLALGMGLGGYRAWEEANRIAAMVHQPPMHLATGFYIVVACFSLIPICARSIRNGPISSILPILGAMSYPLYLVHQTAGYALINFMTLHAPFLADPRPAVMVVMLLASYMIALHVEPRLKVIYKSTLERLFSRRSAQAARLGA
jgi:peptidoglycan/LPS O-acetylase OafA/YrhL